MREICPLRSHHPAQQGCRPSLVCYRSRASSLMGRVRGANRRHLHRWLECTAELLAPLVPLVIFCHSKVPRPAPSSRPTPGSRSASVFRTPSSIDESNFFFHLRVFYLNVNLFFLLPVGTEGVARCCSRIWTVIVSIRHNRYTPRCHVTVPWAHGIVWWIYL